MRIGCSIFSALPCYVAIREALPALESEALAKALDLRCKEYPSMRSYFTLLKAFASSVCCQQHTWENTCPSWAICLLKRFQKRDTLRKLECSFPGRGSWCLEVRFHPSHTVFGVLEIHTLHQAIIGKKSLQRGNS